MRRSVALVATLVTALVLSGCSSADDAPTEAVGIAATDLTANSLNQTMFPLRFAGGTREADLLFTETFGQTDGCLIEFPACPAASQRALDLTPAVPAEAPVELTIKTDQDSSVDLELMASDTTILKMSEEGTASGTSLNVLLVRAPSGTLSLQLTLASSINPNGATVVVSVHTVSRADVVPAFLPVAIELGPGDVVNATGDGLEHFVAFPPSGEPIRSLQYPFSLTVPAEGAKGTYYLLASADEAVKLLGPNRTLSARLLDFVQTEPVDLAPNQATTFTMDVAGFPLHAGVGFRSKALAPDMFLHGLTLMGNHQVKLVSPDKVDVLGGAAVANCNPMCEVAFLGSMDGIGYSSGFLNEHLKAGTYEATVTMETSNDVQAYAFALSIRAS